MPEEPILLKVPTVASLLAVSQRTVEDLLSREELPSLLIGRARRIRRVDIDAYIEQRLEAEKDAPAVHVQPLAPDTLCLLDGRRKRKTAMGVHSQAVKQEAGNGPRRPARRV